MRKQGVPLRRQGVPKHLYGEAAALYAAGWSLAKLSERYRSDDVTVRRALTQSGVEIRPRPGWSGRAVPPSL